MFFQDQLNSLYNLSSSFIFPVQTAGSPSLLFLSAAHPAGPDLSNIDPSNLLAHPSLYH
jgi:hypothetical protein